MQFRVLGEVGLVPDGGAFVRVTAPRQRALLAVLIVNANRTVSPSILADALWGDAQPRDPLGALQVLLSRLRVMLGAYGDRVVSEPGGYRLDVGPEETDLLLAEGLLREGRAALGRDETARAAVHLERGLSLWTGRPLEGVPDMEWATDAERRLRELRVSLVEARNEAYLLGGRHLDVLVDIEEFVAAEPLREQLREQQVVALYRAGRQVQALRVCDTLRRLLRDELGVEPSPAMAALERRVLDHDPGLLASDAGFMTVLPAWTAESLPFIGREAEYERVLACLAAAVVDGVRVVSVEGEPGIGKSRFLLHVAHRVADDVIVLPVDARDVFHPALRGVARVLAEATRRISDAELREIIESFPGVSRDIGRVRAGAAAMAAGRSPSRAVRDEELVQNVGPWIAALSAKAPVVLLIDDLDSVGTALLHVIWQLTTLPVPKRVLVVGSARERYDETSSTPFARTMTALERRHLLERVRLEPLEVSNIGTLLERLRISSRAEVIDRLHRLTGGNPFLLAETLSIASPEDVGEQWPTPPRVLDVVRQRTAELGRATAQLCDQACLFEDDFSVDVLAEVAGVGEAVVATLIDRAVAAHILQASSLNSFRFTHQLFRHALVADLSPQQRAEGNRRIASVLERIGAPPALLAAHWSAATGPDVPAKVLQYARAAGIEALRLFEPRTAIEWFELALGQPHGDRAERGRLLVDLAQAQRLAGDPRGNETLREAVDLALTTVDPELTIRLVGGITPDFSAPPGLPRGAADEFLAHALRVVTDDAMRSRVMGRQAIEVSFSDPDTAEGLADEAVALARRSGDAGVLAEVLLRRCSVSHAPHSLDTRRAVLEELATLDTRPTDIPIRYFGLAERMTSAIQAGDVQELERHEAEADMIAGRYDLPAIRWNAMVRHAWRAGLAGQLDHAEQLIGRARAFGTESALANASEVGLMQLGLLRWQQDRIPETQGAVRAAFDAVAETFPGVALVLARALAAEQSGHAEARSLLSTLAGDGFARLRRGPYWSTVLVLSAETACILDLPDVSAAVRDLLLPFADQVAFCGVWVTAPISYGIGVAMTGCRDPHAEELLEQAVRTSERLQGPTHAARARQRMSSARR